MCSYRKLRLEGLTQALVLFANADVSGPAASDLMRFTSGALGDLWAMDVPSAGDPNLVCTEV